ncbi:MAG: transcriptional regulator [Terracidiphilus sp.]
MILVFSVAPELASQTLWTSVGPPGGDARALVAVPGQPGHLYLGTTNSWIYESVDEGAHWHRLARLEPSEEVVLDNILVDAANPAVIYAGGWKAEQRDGGLWVGRDEGKQWKLVEALRGQSILSLAQAPSNPRLLFAGTLEGVFRSSDGGSSWKRISPPGSREIHEVESLAVDPVDPNIVYAGTWHLPWKTADGGKSWHNIKKGLIDDSDVFSIVVDPARPKTVFLSACSGIYKSENGGELFHKIQGIPATARRTRVLMQDPENREVVYAGTTEGLYKTLDGGKTFRRMTGPDVVVNDVFVDPQDSNRVLLATDRGGVLASKDGGASFAASNQGFSGRKVAALLVDRNIPGRLFAGVVNDKSYGGVFLSADGGGTWEQIGEGFGGGLDGRDVFVLAQAADGTVLAGTSHGIFALEAANRPNDKDQTSEASGPDGGKPVWQPRNTIANTRLKTATETHHGEHVNVEKQVKEPAFQLESRANALDLSGDVWVASTGFGLLTSRDQGASWQGGPVMGSNEYLSVTAHGALMASARADGVVLSTDSGSTWMPMAIPTMLTRIHRVAFSADGTLWLGAREGVYFTRDKGKTWLWIERLPFRDVDDLYYDAAMNKVLVSSRTSDQVYSIDPKTLSWKWSRTGYGVALIRASGGRLLAASLYDGVLVEPQAAEVKTGQK